MRNKLRVRALCIIFVFISFLLIPFIIFTYAQKNSDITWLQSQSISIKLGIWLKYSKEDLRPYDALFIVTDSDGEDHISKKHVSMDDEWWYVFFPDDFSTYSKVGRYSWKCIVNESVAAKGDFEYISSLQAKVIFSE